jgi:TonB family protein
MELVAGGGDNYGATEAPALGEPTGIKLNLPAPPAPPAEPPPTPPDTAEPAPEVPPAQVVDVTPPIPKPAAKPAPKAPPKTPTKAPAKPAHPADLTRVLHRAEVHREWVDAQREKKERAAEEAAERKLAAAEKLRNAHARIDAEGIREGVLGGSTSNKTGGAGGKALTREEGDLLDAYFAMLKARLSESLDEVKPTDVSDSLHARVSFFVAADGSISSVHIIRSSGNGEFDSAVMEAFRHTRSIGARPDHKGETVTIEMKMREDDSQ